MKQTWELLHSNGICVLVFFIFGKITLYSWQFSQKRISELWFSQFFLFLFPAWVYNIFEAGVRISVDFTILVREKILVFSFTTYLQSLLRPCLFLLLLSLFFHKNSKYEIFDFLSIIPCYQRYFLAFYHNTKTKFPHAKGSVFFFPGIVCFFGFFGKIRVSVWKTRFFPAAEKRTRFSIEWVSEGKL